MSNTTITKVDSRFSPSGEMGQKYLASGVHVGMRLWSEHASEEKPQTARDYETVGYVVSGTADVAD